MAAPSDEAVVRALRRLLEPHRVLDGRAAAPYLRDATEARGLVGSADAVALPETREEVAAIARWSAASDVPLVPRGGGTGYAGGAVPQGGVVVSLERLTRVRAFDPLLWRAELEAGITTAAVRRLARESGLLYPPDPGAAERSQLGGNIATNAGGPHTFKYGVTRAWVTGVEVVLPSGDLIRSGGPLRKDVSGYDLTSLVVGSEGTLGIVTAAWLRFVPLPESSVTVVAFYPDVDAGAAAVRSLLASDVTPSAIEYLDGAATALARESFPGGVPVETGFVVIADADGSRAQVEADRSALVEALGDGALGVRPAASAAEAAALWRWREGIGLIADAALGGKVSEDIVVPIDRLAEAIEATTATGARHEVAACSWGHAGDGNLHATFLFGADDAAARSRALAAADELFDLAFRLDGSVSGEHGVGLVKEGRSRRHWPAPTTALHDGVKRLFDPRGLMNPGKKVV